MIKTEVYKILSRQNCLREGAEIKRRTIEGLPTQPNVDFLEFFDRFRGPVGSEKFGYQILDLTEDEPSVMSATAQIRKNFSLPLNYLVISSLEAGGVLVYDCVSDAVYDVDFEGGYGRLMHGQLNPRWHSFSEFISEFFL